MAKTEKDLMAIETPIYGECSFKSVTNRKVIEKWGRVSCRVIDVIVPLLGTGLVAEAAIWAERKMEHGEAIVIFEGSLPRGLTVDSSVPDADDVIAYFKNHIETAATLNPSYASASDASAALLLGTTREGVKGATVPKVQRTRLVHKPTAERPPSQPPTSAAQKPL